MLLQISLGLGTGILLGGAAAWIVLAMRGRRIEHALVEAKARVEMTETRLVEAGERVEVAEAAAAASAERREEAACSVVAMEEKLVAADERLAGQQKAFEEARAALVTEFKATGADALRSNNEQFIALATKTFEGLLVEARGDGEKRHKAIDELVKPVRELLERQRTSLESMEQKHVASHAALNTQLEQVISFGHRLGKETERLVTALRRPEQRGRWGELQLRNAVESAGMVHHCDFEEQPTVRDADDLRHRPDMTVRLPGGGVIVVDAKVALDAYLAAIEPDADRDAMLAQHARQVGDHIRSLASKRYWDRFERTPELVIMFMPLESALVAALEVRPELQSDAMKNKVLLASPTLLVALLRSIAFGWNQEDVAENARAIAKTGHELYERLHKFVEHLEGVRKGLITATKAYDNAAGSFERRLMPSARKLKDLHVSTDPPPKAPAMIEDKATPLMTPAED